MISFVRCVCASSTAPSKVLTSEIRPQGPPYVAPVPRRRLRAVSLEHVDFQIHLCGEHNEFLVKASALLARKVFACEVSFLRGRLVNRSSRSVTGTNQRIEVLEANSSQPLPRASQEGCSLLMQVSTSLADETFFVFLTHVLEQFIVAEGAFATEVTHRVGFNVDSFRFL